MALTTIGVGTADFDARADLLFPAVGVREQRGYAFFVRANPPATVLTLQYLNLFAILSNGANEYETPLLAKFFPKGRMMGFSVGVPRLSFMRNPDCQILAQPKEFFPGAGPIRAVDIELMWDDRDDFQAQSVPVLSGI